MKGRMADRLETTQDAQVNPNQYFLSLSMSRTMPDTTYTTDPFAFPSRF